jgi:hypothetical protein
MRQRKGEKDHRLFSFQEPSDAVRAIDKGGGKASGPSISYPSIELTGRNYHSYTASVTPATCRIELDINPMPTTSGICNLQLGFCLVVMLQPDFINVGIL